MNDGSPDSVDSKVELLSSVSEHFRSADLSATVDEAQDTTPVLPQLGEETQAEVNDVDDQDEAAQLAALTAGARDQEDLERSIGQQADRLLLEQADERDAKRLEKTQRDKDRLASQIRKLEEKLAGFGNQATKNKWRAEVQHYKVLTEGLDKDLQAIQKRIDERHDGAVDGEGGEKAAEENVSGRMPGESQREYLIRTGKITPFSKMGRGLVRASSSLGEVLMEAENEEEEDEEMAEEAADEQAAGEQKSHRNLIAPGFEAEEQSMTDGDAESDAALARRLQDEEFAAERPAKRRRLQTRRQARETSVGSTAGATSDDAFVPDELTARAAETGEGSDDEDGGDMADTAPLPKRKGRTKSRRTTAIDDAAAAQEDSAGIDDGSEGVYQARLKSWVKRRSAARQRFRERKAAGEVVAEDLAEDADFVKGEDEPEADLADIDENEEEWHLPHPARTDAEFEGGFRIPGDIYPALFDYQKTGVQWLWELYSQQVGGIVGDEMGLGKTVQIAAFLAGLHYSKKLTKPIIVVCPATVMKQWVNEFHRWWPPLRVSILHTSGSGMLDVSREARIEDDLEAMEYGRRKTMSKGVKAAKRIVDKVAKDGHILVTTYSGLQTYAELLIPMDWEYAVLDEGHKIRNPNTAITIYCKELRTHNRVILSGTPMQNNLTELWSLFDFVFPMRLGTLVSFRNQFEIPIKQGGYANASNLQVETAGRCAETLKDTISPYLLQRFKIDVAADLPKKSERVLFCKLTKLQLETYQWFLESEDMKSIIDGKRQALYGVDILRKICNHPDLTEHKTLSKKAGYKYGRGEKSGKMQVVKALLEIWRKHGHKTLLFAQHRIMLDILEEFIRGMPGFRYRRMDGNTSIKDRQDLVDEFNRDPDLHVFLLTTKVGGLGINLTGADRVIIYDPDWNPSTDVQARERAWRLGQKREVEIYRLMTAGTIEEKIYHRQIFKQFLTNKILRDPKQRQTFQLKDLHDLFTLGNTEGETETGSIFKGTEVQLTTKDISAENETSLPTPPDDTSTPASTTAVSGIPGLSRLEDYRGNVDEDAAAEAKSRGETPEQNDRMLSSIFARTGVHSALEHDAIINGPRTLRADPEIIAREAKRVAAAAARELQRAGVAARNVPAGVPTWTGTVGTSGRPDSAAASTRGGRAARGGRGSTAVLANLASRQAPTSDPPPRSAASTSRSQPKGAEFVPLIRDFLRAQGGSAPTQMLIDHFNRFCRDERRTAEFREGLKVVAELDKTGGGNRSRGGRGLWALRREFR
nr:hypothetical protein B0A51_05906 [Rachicladosporium sp. CCFEE 5018]